MYSCSDDGLSVSYIHYETDASCSDAALAAAGPTYTMEGVEPGDLYSFNCDGTNSYMKIKSVLNDPTCCSASPISTNIATNVCYRDVHGSYTMAKCNGARGMQFGFEDASCDSHGALDEHTPEYQLFSDECVLFDTFFVVDMHSVLDQCVHQDVVSREPSLCGFESTETPNATSRGHPFVLPPHLDTLCYH